MSRYRSYQSQQKKRQRQRHQDDGEAVQLTQQNKLEPADAAFTAALQEAHFFRMEQRYYWLKLKHAAAEAERTRSKTKRRKHCREYNAAVQSHKELRWVEGDRWNQLMHVLCKLPPPRD